MKSDVGTQSHSEITCLIGAIALAFAVSNYRSATGIIYI